MLLRKETGGTTISWRGRGYTWPEDDPVCDVPVELAVDLLAIRGSGYSEVPETPEASGADGAETPEVPETPEGGGADGAGAPIEPAEPAAKTGSRRKPAAKGSTPEG